MGKKTTILTLPAESMIVVMALKPIIQGLDDEVNIDNATSAGIGLLTFVNDVEDVELRIKTIHLVRMVAQIMGISELMEHDTVKTLSTYGLAPLKMDAIQSISDLADFDQEGYWNFIMPFIKDIGVEDIDGIIEDLILMDEVIAENMNKEC